MARAAALLLVLCAAGPSAATRSPSALRGLAGYGSAGRSLLQDQTSCCREHLRWRWPPWYWTPGRPEDD
ncbi:hypothetical protein Rsub_04372 [Raphidocelis subcapitata]|uniref:Uncharacterized protein n=1 Tax=Raphidocelis subcapitata TaxID=307507 RepID=A0A2V0NY75_9CHLO|nr:hypothetical protein Rsub_04372 [Raphidocelis subcapitata]|eukprot:GBF91632.1 hypothetical protein Rsub_04372 [Raphidocelis subcapitata]